MTRIAVIGLGNMGSGMARNLAAAGYDVRAHDRNAEKRAAAAAAGATAADNVREAGAGAEVAIIIVMDGAQAAQVARALAEVMGAGATVILCATIRAAEARAIAANLARAGIGMIDCPVTGGYAGAQAGTLTLIAAGSDAALAACKGPMEAIGARIFRAGTEPGQGQTAKACLQTIVGASVSAACEAAALAAKAGVDGATFQEIVSASAAGSPVTSDALRHIIDRQFHRTGARIGTLHKDLTISTEMARELGVPLTLAPAALALMAEAAARDPTCDIWAAAWAAEEAGGAALRRRGDGE